MDLSSQPKSLTKTFLTGTTPGVWAMGHESLAISFGPLPRTNNMKGSIHCLAYAKGMELKPTGSDLSRFHKFDYISEVVSNRAANLYIRESPPQVAVIAESLQAPSS